MKRNLLFIGTLMTGILFVFFLSTRVAAEIDGKTNIETTKEKKGVAPQPVDQKGKEPAPPIYQPPLRGAPGGRVGGGTRGIGEELIALFALTPNHVALTVQEQPTLYWYLSKPAKNPIELTIISEKDTHPLLKTHIPLPSRRGLYPLRLSDFNIRLTTGTLYQWFLTLILDPNRRSRDIVAGAIIERVEVPKTLRSRLLKANREKIPHVYAAAGIWYDAFMAISNLIAEMPDNPVFRKHRAALLEQVGLSAVAQYDLEQEGTGK